MPKPKHHRSWMRRIPTPVLLLIVIVGLLLMISAVKAEAGYCAGYGIRYVQQEWPHASYRERYCRRWVRDDDEGARVYGYSRRWNDDEDDRSGRLCKDTRKAVGDQHISVDGAKKAANDAWAGAVRFHFGEKWMALDNARHLVYTCSRSSIKEQGASVTTLGQALHRCELEAQPCAPLREHEKREDDR